MAKRSAGTVAVNVKLLPGRAAQPALEALAQAPGVVHVEQTFPEESDPELARLYVLQVERPRLESALRALRKAPGVEYAEPAPARKPLRDR